MAKKRLSKRLTKAELLEAAIDAIREMRDGRLETQGGYPADIDSTTIPGFVLVADVDHDEAPTLSVYGEEDLIEWYKDALRFLREHKDDEYDYDLVSAMYETQPDGIDLTRYSG